LKLRIQNNSIRFRLTRKEVDALRDTGRVSAAVSFADGSCLEYSIETSTLTGQLRANYSAGGLAVQIPQATARQWAVTDEVSITGAQPLENGELAILVEKDFACLVPREGEDEIDLFPHPRKGQDTC
jgi:hypothetical protein